MKFYFLVFMLVLSSCSSSNPDSVDLSNLTISVGTLSPTFSKDTLTYSARVPLDTIAVTFVATLKTEGPTLTINGLPLFSGKESTNIILDSTTTEVEIKVTSYNKQRTVTYIIDVVKTAGELESILQGSDTTNSDKFGWSIVSDDTTLVTGAPFASNGSGPGAVYVFSRVSSSWVETQKLTASDGQNGDLFGWSVALDGDLIAVGAPHKDHNNDPDYNDSGAVYIFKKSGGIWSQVGSAIESPSICNYNYFGWSVALQGNTLAVGEPDTGPLPCAVGTPGGYYGSVQIYSYSGTWTSSATLTASDHPSNNYFGEAIALENGTIAVGAKGRSANAGAVYIFTGAGATWSQRTIIRPSTTYANSYFGAALSLNEGRLVVGAEAESSTGTIYLFAGSGNSWQQAGNGIKASSPTADDYFGHSVSIKGDVIGIGAPGTLTPANRGYATLLAKQHLFLWSQVGDPIAPSGIEASLSRYGQSIFVTDTQILVGADNYDLDGSGAVYVYH